MAKVRDPAGTEWDVNRRWFDGFRVPRWRGRDPGVDGLDLLGDLGDAGPLAILGVIVAVIALVLLLAFVALPLLFFGAELVVVLVVTLGGLAGRLVLGHPWLIEARVDGRVGARRRVAGWTASREAVTELLTQVRTGAVAVPPVPVAGVGAGAGALPVTEPPDAGRETTELRLQVAIAVVMALLWLGGVGSVLALLSASSVLEGSDERGTRAAAWTAIVLAVLGIALTILLAIGIVNGDPRLR